MKTFDIITIFPEMFGPVITTSIIGRAVANDIVHINLHNLRDYTLDKHRTVDDTPYGGGPGMLFKVEPVYNALKSLTENFKASPKRRVILLDPRGKSLDQSLVELSARQFDHFILIAPRYEGVDERILRYVDDTISIGDYILSGGELPAMVYIDAVIRQIPGALGKNESLDDETFKREGYTKYPQYTVPREFMGDTVPEVLLSGDHKKIEGWKQQSGSSDQKL
jgi:tRNA (guanine37-N1)-methyltransferase